MRERDLPTRLHELLTELLGALLEHGADRQLVGDWAQEAVDLVHAVADLRQLDPRHIASLKQARFLAAALEASRQAGTSPEDAAAAARARMGLSRYQFHRLQHHVRELAQRPRLTIPASTENPHADP